MPELDDSARLQHNPGAVTASWRNWQTQRIQNPDAPTEIPDEEPASSNVWASTETNIANTNDPVLALIVSAWDSLPADVQKTIEVVVRSSLDARRPKS